MAAVELRVHGVGGSTPEQVLDGGPAQRVAGDADAGFYRATDPDLEAYCWGNLTSGAASRALWLLMLPFTLVNASFWMGPVRRTNEALVRLLALSLTATAILAVEGVGTDLLGWQCAGRAACRDRHTWLRWIGDGTAPGRRLVVGALVPLLGLGLLWVLARRTARYERVEPIVEGGKGALEDPTFWYGARQVDRLRQLHVAVGLAVVGLGMAWPLWDWDRNHGTALRVADLVLVVGMWLVMVLASIAVCLPAVVRRDPPGERGVLWTKAVQATAIALVVAATLLAVVPGRGSWVDHAAPQLPGYATAVTTVFLAQLVGVLVLTVVVLPHRDLHASALGLAQPAFAALGLLLASVLASGLAFRVADYLDGARAPTDESLRLPVAYSWAALALLVVAVPAVPYLGLHLLRRVRRVTAEQKPRVRAAYHQETGLDGRVAYVGRKRAIAGLTDGAAAWIAWLTAVSLVAAVASMVLTLLFGEAPVRAAGTGTGADLLRWGTLGGTWLVSGVAAGVLFVGYRSYRTASLRKTVGILWDLGTFWPRAAHPLAPPCYTERCLPDLTTRVEFLVRESGGVVVSAHSQGTVIAAALMWQLPPEVLRRVGLITYGSPLARLYGQLYSSWCGPAALTELQTRMGPDGWRNLWRPTDPIGGPVGTAADRELPCDPPCLDRVDGDPSYAAPSGHFDYELTPEYAEELRSMRARV
jgi:hypothetical protein